MFADKVQAVADRIQHLVSCLREISEEERCKLETRGNIIAGARILVCDSFSSWDTIRNNVFMGTVVLNGFTKCQIPGPSGLPSLSSCISGSSFSDVVIDGPCFVKDCAMLHSVYISEGCILIGNGVVTGNFSTHRYGIGSEIVLCEETGTRTILSHPDCCTLSRIEWSLESNANRKSFNENVLDLMKGFEGAVSARFMGCVFEAKVVAMKCGKLESLWVSSGVELGSSEISRCYIEPKAKIDNSIIERSIIGKCVSVEGFSVVENSILDEFSKVSIHGKMVHSFLGSYSGVESGECISSLIGPFVGFHHQSLCIATYWPGGRGNIGYGANVGSNHSGKAPDCELIAGEGIFFGLATVIKFPCNFAKAPYSLIASGVTCLPQRMEMPFSLINTGSMSSEYPGLNEISPGWILSDNMFTLLRNEDKFSKRQKPEASTVYEHQIFRPEIMRLVVHARKRLSNVTLNPKNGVYTETNIEGLGKNYLKEAARQRAIDTYSFIIRWYGLRGLYRRIMEVGTDATMREIDGIRNGGLSLSEEWRHCLDILLMERMNLKETKSLMEEFSKLDFLISSNCVSSKTKDDVRGAKIIGDSHREFHPPASEHSVCLKAKKNSAEIEANVTKIVSRL